MNHASRLVCYLPSVCGEPLDEVIARGDRVMAAINETGQALVDCLACREGLGLPVAYLETGGERVGLMFNDDVHPDTWAVSVPGVGTVIFLKRAEDLPAGTPDTAIVLDYEWPPTLSTWRVVREADRIVVRLERDPEPLNIERPAELLTLVVKP